MLYQIRGAHRDTGEDVVTEIAAGNAAEAEEIARSEGILISRVAPLAAAPTPPPLAPVARLAKRPGEASCPMCGAGMIARKVSTGNFTGIILALIVFVVGAVLLICVPCLGWVVGPLLMLLALGMGGKRHKVWECVACRHQTPRGV